MNPFSSPSASSCGCCEGVEKLTPRDLANRPGLPALSYRIGNHAEFLTTMVARLASMSLPSDDPDGSGKPPLDPLRRLTTRLPDDPSIALLDAWATVASILSFYQERIANEGYLRTAVERRSILELARLVGYTLRPGVSASVYLAYTLEKDNDVLIPVSSRAQSLPGPGQLPQSFETGQPLDARAAWNNLQVRLSRPQSLKRIIRRLRADSKSGPKLGAQPPTENIYLKGLTTNIKPNDAMLLMDQAGSPKNPSWVYARVEAVAPDATANRTQVALRPWGMSALPGDIPVPVVAVRDIVPARSPAEQIGAIADSFGKLGDFSVPENSPRAKRVLADVEELRESLEPGVTEDSLGQAKGIMSRLSEEHKTAVERGGPVAPWLGSLLEELTTAVPNEAQQPSEGPPSSEAPPPEDHQPPEPESSPRPKATAHPARRSAQGALTSIITGLLKSPALHPANAQHLDRKIAAPVVSKAMADIASQILVALKPELKSRLYLAWANAVVTPAPPHDAFQAMRVKASPFGYNAPLKTAYDGKGGVAGTEEWPLYGALEFSVSLSFASFARSGGIGLSRLRLAESVAETSVASFVLQATITVKLGTASQTASIAIPLTQPDDKNQTVTTLPVGDQQVKVTINYNANRQFTGVTFELVRKTEVIQPEVIALKLVQQKEVTALTQEQNTSALDIELTAKSVALLQQRISWGQTFRYPVSGHKIAVDATEDAQTGRFFLASIESPLPAPDGRRNVLALDAQYDQITPGSIVLIDAPDLKGPTPPTSPPAAPNIAVRGPTPAVQAAAPMPKAYTVKATRTLSRTDYGLNTKVTELTLDRELVGDDDLQLSAMRSAVVYAGNEALDLAWEPIDPIKESVGGKKLELDGLYKELQPGRWLIVSGERTDLTTPPGPSGVTASELVMLAGVDQSAVTILTSGETTLPGDKTHTTIQLAGPGLAYHYKRDTVIVYGNVVAATHGETRAGEVLGSGDAGKPFQTFALRQSPLTHLSAPTASGSASTLKVYVNDILRHEVAGLDTLGPTDRGFVTRTDDDAKTSVIFGNGQRGARLPTGQENVKATYRTGIGKPGNVGAGQISLLATRPLGVKSVVNPLAATGGADKEGPEQARRNTPLGITALDRLISVRDYEDFARTFAGIGKAYAARLSDGHRQVVHLTIAGAEDIPIDRNSDLYRNLGIALRQSGDPAQPIMLAVRELMLLLISARVRVLPDYLWEKVEPKIREMLLNRFSFDNRDLGQSVFESEVISAIQAVEGVAYVVLDILDSVAETISLTDLADLGAKLEKHEPKPRIVVNLTKAARKGGAVSPAQLAYLTPAVPDTLILKELPA